MLRSKTCLLAAALSFALSVGACDDDNAPSPIEAQDFCAALATAACEGMSTCCGDALSAVDLQRCERIETDFCQTSLVTLDDLGLGPTGPGSPARIVFNFDEAGAGRAVARVRSELASCRLSRAVQFGDVHVLGDLGVDCLRDGDCLEGARCQQGPGAVFGACVVAPLEGEACESRCAASDLECIDVSVFEQTSSPSEWVCVGPRGRGQLCSFDLGCDRGLYCDGWSRDLVFGVGDGGGQCVPQLPVGERCSEHFECASEYCDASSRCAAQGTEAYRQEHCARTRMLWQGFTPGFGFGLL